MALVKSKTKIEGGWSYRGFDIIKSGSSIWNVNLISSDITMNDNIQKFINDTHKQLKKSCEFIDGLYDGIPYTSEKSIKIKESENKMKDSWNKFHKDSRSKKCEEIFKSIYSELKGLHFGEQKRSYDELGNVRYYWLPVNTDYATHLGYPTWNIDVLEELADRFKDTAFIHTNTPYSFTIEILMEDKELESYYLQSA